MYTSCKKAIGMLAAIGLVASLANVAGADEIVNDVPVVADVKTATIVSAGTGVTVTYRISHPDDSATAPECDASFNTNQGGKPVTVTPNTGANVAASPTSVSWSTNAECESAVKTITFTSSAPGAHSITHDVDYTLRNGDERSMTDVIDFTLNVRPRPATALTADGGLNKVDLDWSASADTGIDGYKVYQDGGTTPVATTTATDAVISGLADNTRYCFTVTAYKGALESDHTAAACDWTDAASVTYTGAFQQPLDGNGVLNKAKLGRVVPVKLAITASNSSAVPGAVYFRSWKAECTVGAGTDTVESYSAGSSNLGNTFRPTDTGWIYNLDTSKLAGATVGNCYQLDVYVGGTVDEATGIATGGVAITNGSVKITLTK